MKVTFRARVMDALLRRGFILPRVRREFANNLIDWLSRQPDGPISQFTRIVSVELIELPVDDVLKKNQTLLEKWHVDFLSIAANHAESRYATEYLGVIKHGDPIRLQREFLDLRDSVREVGILRPLWVADVGEFNLGFRYFRFNGSHRIAAATTLGMSCVPVFLFRLERVNESKLFRIGEPKTSDTSFA